MRHLLPFSWSSNTHFNFFRVKIYMNKSIVCFGGANEIWISGASFSGVGKCFLS